MIIYIFSYIFTETTSDGFKTHDEIREKGRHPETNQQRLAELWLF